MEAEKNFPETDAKIPVISSDDGHIRRNGTMDSDEMQFKNRWTKKLLQLGVEARGIFPVPVEQRTDRQFTKIFFIWFSMNFNILAFSAGTIGPVVFGLSLRDSALVILFFNVICAVLPSYLCTWGPKLGLRQMCQARYSFGYYGVIIPCLLNLTGMCGFCILNCILGGQTLASVSNGNLNWSVGIVVVAVISFVVSFFGYRVLNWFERLVWIPVLVAFCVVLGVSGKHLSNPPPSSPATIRSILSYASTIAGYTVTYAPLSSDFTMYYHSSVPSWRLFTYSMFGFLIPIVTIQIFGAACAIAAPLNPSWNDGYAGGNIGGLISAMLSPVGTFGKILVVLLGLNLTSNIAVTFYSITLNFQIAIPYLVAVPRYALAIIATAIIIPVSLIGAHKFYTTLTNFLSVLGYWASMFCAVVLVEHFVFRRRSFESYDIRYWNSPRHLPSGLAALAACFIACGMVVPSMDQTWWVGPIGKNTGDLGFEFAFVTTGVMYTITRKVELLLRRGKSHEDEQRT